MRMRVLRYLYCSMILYASCEEMIVAREEQALGLARNFLLVI